MYLVALHHWNVVCFQTLQDLNCVSELLDSCTLMDLGSDLQTSRLLERFSHARPHFIVSLFSLNFQDRENFLIKRTVESIIFFWTAGTLKFSKSTDTYGTSSRAVQPITTFNNYFWIWCIWSVLYCGLAHSLMYCQKDMTRHTLFSSPATGRWGGVPGEELGDSERSAGRAGGEGVEGKSSEGGGSVRGAEDPEESEGQDPSERVDPGPNQQIPPHIPTGQWSREEVILLRCINKERTLFYKYLILII